MHFLSRESATSMLAMFATLACLRSEFRRPHGSNLLIKA